MYVKHKVRHDLATEQQQVYKYDWFILTLYPATLVNSLINSKNFFLNCCSVTKSCLTLCDLMDYCVPGFLILHCLPEFAQTHIHWISDAIQPSHSLSPPSSPALSLSQHEGLFQWVDSASGGHSVGASASASVLPMNIQGWFPLGLSDLILLSKGLSRVFSSTTIL